MPEQSPKYFGIVMRITTLEWGRGLFLPPPQIDTINHISLAPSQIQRSMNCVRFLFSFILRSWLRMDCQSFEELLNLVNKAKYYNCKGTHFIMTAVSDGGVWNKCSLCEAITGNKLNLPDTEPLSSRTTPIPYNVCCR